MRKLLIGVVVVAALLVVGAPRVRASGADPINVISFSGSGSHGTINPASFPWEIVQAPLLHRSLIIFNNNIAAAPTWPAPPTHQDITDFTITFQGLTIAGSTPATGSFFATFTSPWHGVLSNQDHTITFTAPAGMSLNSGDSFSSAISFTHAVDSVRFRGAFSAVPEPSSMLLFGSGLLLLVLIVSHKQLHGREISA